MKKVLNYLREWRPTSGEFASACFILVVITGIGLLFQYEVTAPFQSLKMMSLSNAGGAFLRSAHYWSAQLLVIALFIHVIKYLIEFNARLYFWVKSVLLGVLILYLMISGFILKGDAEGILARSVLVGMLERAPLLGTFLKDFLVGKDDSLLIIYIQHCSIATIAAISLLVTHFSKKMIMPKAWICSGALVIILSFFMHPTLHDPLNPIIKGPWIFLPLQEIMHWLSQPVSLVIAIILLLLLFVTLPVLPQKIRFYGKKGFVLIFSFYALLIIFSFFFRGENWTFRWIGLFPQSYDSYVVYQSGIPIEKMSLNVEEGCMLCHEEMKGFIPGHEAKEIGCHKCHLGNMFNGNAAAAHKKMVKEVGDFRFAETTCGGSNCHKYDVEKIAMNNSFAQKNCYACHQVESTAKDHPKTLSEVDLSRCIECHLKDLNNDNKMGLHAEIGMNCIDCHGKDEMMSTAGHFGKRNIGDTLSCLDCHGKENFYGKTWQELSSEEKRITKKVFSHNQDFENYRFGVIAKTGGILPNVLVRKNKRKFIFKGKQKSLAIPFISNSCRPKDHPVISCRLCHDTQLQGISYKMIINEFGEQEIAVNGEVKNKMHNISRKGLQCINCHPSN